jgi:hypothetical protein
MHGKAMNTNEEGGATGERQWELEFARSEAIRTNHCPMLQVLDPDYITPDLFNHTKGLGRYLQDVPLH